MPFFHSLNKGSQEVTTSKLETLPSLGDIEFRLRQTQLRTKEHEQDTNLPAVTEPVYYKPPHNLNVKMPFPVPPRVSEVRTVNDEIEEVLPGEWMDPNVMPALRNTKQNEATRVAWSLLLVLVVRFLSHVGSTILPPTVDSKRSIVSSIVKAALILNAGFGAYNLFTISSPDASAFPTHLTNEQRQLLGLASVQGAPSASHQKKATLKHRIDHCGYVQT
ncbi:hypothetical protein DICA3_A07998 [Diutina catenulata]